MARRADFKPSKTASVPSEVHLVLLATLAGSSFPQGHPSCTDLLCHNQPDLPIVSSAVVRFDTKALLFTGHERMLQLLQGPLTTPNCSEIPFFRYLEEISGGMDQFPNP